MANNVQIVRNFPRTELVRDGWAKSRLASAIQPALYRPGWDDPQISHASSYVKSTLPKEFWQEPNTGIIMLKPSVLDSDFWESDTKWVEDTLPINYWHVPGIIVDQYGNRSGIIAAQYNNGMISVRSDISASAMLDLGLIPLALRTILNAMRSQLRWVMQTRDPLAQNEGWTVIVHPPGIYTERATDYMLISFGGKYVLHLRMDGTASLWSLLKTKNRDGSEGSLWIERTTFKYSGGGVEHGKPFQVTVIPWGFGYISFIFSQSSEPQAKAKNEIRTGTGTTFLYDIAKEEGEEVLSYDSATLQWVKTQTAPLSVAIREKYFQYSFVFARVRYKEGGVLPIMPEVLPQAMPQEAPQVSVRGFYGQKSPEGYTTVMTNAVTNETGAAWTKATDVNIVNTITMNPTNDGIYTPELWSLDIKIKPETHTPAWTPSYPTNWTYIRFQRSLDPSPSTSTIKLVNDSYDALFKGWGPIRILIEDVAVFDGYIYQKFPTLKKVIDKDEFGVNRTKAIVRTQLDSRDLWIRLDEKLVYNFVFLNGLQLLDVLKQLIKRAGFVEEDIIVNDPDNYIASITFQGFIDPNDQSTVSQYGNCGDMLRGILKFYSLLPIRVRPIEGQWHIYLAPQYNQATPPTNTFHLVSPGKTDSARIAAHEFNILSDPEFKIEEPEFNALLATVSDSTGEGAVGMESIIPANIIDSNTVENANAFWFIGRVKLRRVFPPEIPFIQSQEELNKVTRVFWDRESKHKPVLEFLGEWRPGIDCDQFLKVYGVDNEGAPCSYGVYRIVTIDVEGQYDFSDRDMRWSWQANYTLTYEGPTNDPAYPMFTSVLP